jgi:hypothetical protein
MLGRRFVREVETSKLAMQFAGFGVVNPCCFLGRIEWSEAIGIHLKANRRNPFPRLPAIQSDTLVTRLAVRLNASISGILTSCRRAKIASSTVQSISILMVDVNPFGLAHDESVQKDMATSLRITPSCVPVRPTPRQRPIELTNKGSVRCVDNRKLALRQRNEQCIGIGRVWNQCARSLSTSVRTIHALTWTNLTRRTIERDAASVTVKHHANLASLIETFTRAVSTPASLHEVGRREQYTTIFAGSRFVGGRLQGHFFDLQLGRLRCRWTGVLQHSRSFFVPELYQFKEVYG